MNTENNSVDVQKNQSSLLLAGKVAANPTGSETLRKSENSAPFKGARLAAEFWEFVNFYGTPRELRELKTQGDFAEKFGISPDTLTGWKQREEFWRAVEIEMHSRENEHRLDVLSMVRRKAMRDEDIRAAGVWLKATHITFPKKEKVDDESEIE